MARKVSRVAKFCPRRRFCKHFTCKKRKRKLLRRTVPRTAGAPNKFLSRCCCLTASVVVVAAPAITFYALLYHRRDLENFWTCSLFCEGPGTHNQVFLCCIKYTLSLSLYQLNAQGGPHESFFNRRLPLPCGCLCNTKSKYECDYKWKTVLCCITLRNSGAFSNL